MHYFIDGYNLMFRVLRAGDDLRVQREILIQDLNRKIQALNLDVTLVFDAQYQEGDNSQSHIQHLEILFTRQGETADELILQKLKHAANPIQHTVITSDKKLAWLARRRNAKTESVEDFLKWLNNRYKNKIKRHKNPPVKMPLSKPRKKIVSEPTVKSTTEKSEDYYLEKFETLFKSYLEAEPIKKERKKEKAKERKIPKFKKTKKDEGLSDMERWQKAFERDLKIE